jgi:hypothetical protein
MVPHLIATTTMKTNAEVHPLTAKLIELGITIHSSNLRPGVEPAVGGSNEWPHIAYDVKLKRGEAIVWSGPYKLGIGHVEGIAIGKTAQQKAEWAANTAFIQNVEPELADVFHSILLDGSAWFDRSTFKDWCAEFGYSDDSIKAKATFDTCVEIGQELEHNLTQEELSALRELASNF